VSVSLTAIADDSNFLALQQVKISILVVVDVGHVFFSFVVESVDGVD